MKWKIIVLLGLILQSATVYAQYTTEIYEKRYRESLLDSAIKLELLKPIVFNLQKTNEYIHKENAALKAQNSLLQINQKMQQQRFELLFSEQSKKHRKTNYKWFFSGFLMGKITPPY